MTLTSTASEAYGGFQHLAEIPSPRAEAPAEPYGFRDLPKLFWAGVVLFAVNAAITMAIGISPEMNVSMYGETPQKQTTSVASKPSPFTEVVQTAAAKPTTAVKLQPVLYV